MSQYGTVKKLLVFALLVVAGCAGASTPEPGDDQARGKVTSADFEDWPFEPSSATLHCVPSVNDDGGLIVTIDFGDGQYALNGEASSAGFTQLDTSLMPEWPDASTLGPVIERGLALCD